MPPAPPKEPGFLDHLTPTLWLALSYLLVTDLSADWRWSVAALVLGLARVALTPDAWR